MNASVNYVIAVPIQVILVVPLLSEIHNQHMNTIGQALPARFPANV